MKILNVHFKNLNSLEGEWQIDFTDPFYISDGIFLITGATGSGKTTVLDAICLALYGATPRLGKITKSTNEIMSRQTGECFAEVIFETLKGRFVCHFSQRRAYEKSDGKLGQPKHEISDADTGKVLESKLRDVVLLVEKKTGMDFDRFTRSILLAQGGFAAFLHATPDERAPILEQITGTEIYSKISILVHEKKTQEQSELNNLQSHLFGMKLLDKEEESELNSKIEEKNIIEAELVKKQDKINKIILYQKELSDKQAGFLETSNITLKKREELAESDIARREIAKKYQTSKEGRKDGQLIIKKVREKDFHILEKKKDMQECSNTIEQDQKTHGQIESNNNVILKDLLNKKDTLIDINRYFEEKSSHSFLVGNLTGIMQMFKTLSQNASKLQNASDHIIKNRAMEKTALENYLKLKKENELIEKKVKEKEKEKQVLKNEIELCLKGNDLSVVRKSLEKLKEREILFDKVLQIQKKIKKDQTIIDKEKVFVTKIEKENSELANKIKSAIKEKKLHEKDIDHIEKQIKLLDKIRDLEQERLFLKSDTPCPLCGSKVHPFASGQTPEKGIEEAALEKIKFKLKRVLKSIEIFKTDKARKETEIIISSEKIIELENEIKISKKEYTSFSASLKFETPLNTVDHVGLNNLFLDIRSKINEKTSLIRDVEYREGRLKKVEKIFGTQKDHQAGFLQNLQKADIKNTSIKEDINRLLKEKDLISDEVKSDKENVLSKIKIFGIKSIKIDEIDNIIQSLKQKQTIFQKNLEKKDILEKEVTSMNSELVNNKDRAQEIKKRIKTNQTYSNQLNKELDRLNKERRYLFGDKEPDMEEKYQNEKVDNIEKIYEKVKQENEKIKHDLTSAETRRKELDKSILTLKENLAGNRQNDFEDKLKTLHNTLKDLQQSMGSIKQQLKQNKETKEKYKEQAGLIENQRKECNRWDVLHELIGSADGKKFRNFAQGLTFELMVSHANQQLISMTDRYLLVRDKIKPLELNVIDNYQAGEIRSTKNLSGGEGFIVSLSLALGLSRMVSRNISVDSLFLDEGFGTLDDDALEIALEALSSLQQSGKIIGLISHVPALKERIGVQIQIKAGMGGRSSITGHGCSKISKQ